MSNYPVIQLKKEKERSVQRFHPWIFSGSLQSFEASLRDGDIVEVQDYKKKFLCIGHFYHGSIAVKILSFENNIINQDFWNNKIKHAFLLRKTLRLIDNKNTNCFRLIHAEGDNCPGLIIDIYDTTAVIQCHTIGMHRAIYEIKNAVENEVRFIDAIYDKSAAYLPKEYAETIENKYLSGNSKKVTAIENGNQF